MKPEPRPERTETATFAAGCFWCVEESFRQQPGVLRATSGYTGGHTRHPSYKEVCTGRTGHAEAVQVEFDPARISYSQLLALFWKLHDPTQLNRQGEDVGTQYRSAIFYHSEEQKQAAEASRADEDRSGRHARPIVTEITAATEFYPAEDYHQEYYRNNKGNPYCRLVVAPKLEKLGLKH